MRRKKNINGSEKAHKTELKLNNYSYYDYMIMESRIRME